MVLTPEEREALITDIASAIHQRSSDVHLSPEEIQYVRLAINKEAQSIKLRQAIIEKTIAGLIWMVILGFGMLILDYAKNHGYKP